MTSSKHLRLPLALLILVALTGCIDSAAPILSGAQPLLGERLNLQLYALHDGAAHDPVAAAYAWRNDRYTLVSGAPDGVGDFTIHRLNGVDLIAQSVRPNGQSEYAVVRKLADGAYLVVAIDENDANLATRRRFCGTEKQIACRVATRKAVLAFARATAAKAHTTGGLAVLLTEQ
jgi:hypothetical protein